jgi:hypothetical protein
VPLRSYLSEAAKRRSRCGSVRGWPVVSSHFSPGLAPQVGQRTARTCFCVTFMGYIVQCCLAARWSILTSAFTRWFENTNWHLANARRRPAKTWKDDPYPGGHQPRHVLKSSCSPTVLLQEETSLSLSEFDGRGAFFVVVSQVITHQPCIEGQVVVPHIIEAGDASEHSIRTTRNRDRGY